MQTEHPNAIVRAAIIGLGWWGQVMVDAALAVPKSNLVFTHALVRNRDRAASFARSRNLELADSLDAVLATSAIDAVVLATPHSVHVDQIIKCAAAGKPVFTEKPIALTLSEARRAIDACDNAGVVLGIGTDRRFLPAMMRLAELVAQGALGTIVHIEGQYSNDNMSRGVSGDWRMSPDEAPGAGMTGPGLHALDSMIRLAGPVVHLSGQIHRPHGQDVPIDAVSLLLKFASGVTGVLGCVRGVQNYFRIAVFGDQGRAELHGFGELRICLNGESERVEIYSPELAIGETLGLFADAVIGSTPYLVSPRAILETVAAFEAAISSFDVRTPQPVAVELITGVQ